MKILFVTSSSINGGAQKHIRDMFIALTKMQNDVFIAAPNGWLLDELNDYKNKIIRMEASLRNVPQLSEVMHKISPDIVNTFILSGGCFGVAAWNKYKHGKIFVTVNNPVIYDGISIQGKLFYPQMYRWMSKSATAFLVKSDSVAEEVKTVIHNKKPVISIKNGIDFSLFDKSAKYNNLRAELGIKDSDYVVSNVAVLNERKGQQHIIDAVTRLRKKMPIHLLLAGEGPEEEKLKKQVSNLHAEEYVHFLGRRSDVNCILSNSNVFVLSSYHEGLPNALMEAMSMEIPCIATDVGGVKQLIEDGVSGLIIEPKSSIAIANAIVAYVEDKSMAAMYARHAYEKVYNEYRQQSVAEELEKIYINY